MMTPKKFAVLAIILAVWSAVHAKGIFQAEGKIAELQMNQGAITFKFAGRISFGYATAPDTHPKRQCAGFPVLGPADFPGLDPP